MIFLLLFFCFTLFSANIIPIRIVSATEKHDYLIKVEDQLNNFELTMQEMVDKAQKTTKPLQEIPIALENIDFKQNSYKEIFQKIKPFKLKIRNKIMSESYEARSYAMSLYAQISRRYSSCLTMITAQTHATAAISSVAVLLLKKFCHKNAAFLLAASLTIPYWYNYDYFKEKNKGPFLNKIVDFTFGLFIAVLMLRGAFYL